MQCQRMSPLKIGERFRKMEQNLTDSYISRSTVTTGLEGTLRPLMQLGDLEGRLSLPPLQQKGEIPEGAEERYIVEVGSVSIMRCICCTENDDKYFSVCEDSQKETELDLLKVIVWHRLE